MFDIGFLELLICAVIALLVLGPERLPTAARAAGRWVGAARRMVSQFSSELDRQLKAEELREELRKAGDVGLDDVQKTVRGALDEAKKYEHMILSDGKGHQPAPMSKDTAADAAPSETSGDQDVSPTPDNQSSTPKQVPPGSPDKRS